MLYLNFICAAETSSNFASMILVNTLYLWINIFMLTCSYKIVVNVYVAVDSVDKKSKENLSQFT